MGVCGLSLIPCLAMDSHCGRCAPCRWRYDTAVVCLQGTQGAVAFRWGIPCLVLLGALPLILALKLWRNQSSLRSSQCLSRCEGKRRQRLTVSRYIMIDQ